MLRHFALGLVAEAHWRAGDIETGLAVIEQAHAEAESADERFFEAELFRLRGEMLMARPGQTNDAEVAFRRALAVAEAQHATLLERRAAASLSTFRS
jgi:predicted RNA polymerase sigma factor